MTVVLDGNNLKIEGVVKVARGGERIQVHNDAWDRIKECRDLLERKIDANEIMYGVNTGIGELSEVVLPRDKIKDFQRYLVYSHAAGYGNPMDIEVVRAAIISRINVHCHGNSGLRPIVVQTLVDMLNKGVSPVMCQRGSVGACGDLSPMSQMALVIIGEGEAFYQGERLPAKEAMERAEIPTIEFEARDGLAAINGSNVITGWAALMIYEAEMWLKLQDIATAMTLEALHANMKAYDHRLHQLRGYRGAMDCAENVRRITEGSGLLAAGRKKVQDSYSMRSTPQVAGAARDTIVFARQMVETELNGVGDNPIFIPQDELVLTGANFQGTPIAFALEFLAIATTTVAALSERRLNRLLNPNLSQGLPAFLTKGAGMFSGMMLSQYTAGQMVNENRVLCNPAATGSIPAAADQEDFVSMGMTSAIKARQITDNNYAILAIELMAAAQAFDFREAKPSPGSQAAYNIIRRYSDHLEEDRPLYEDHNILAEVVRSGEILEAVEKVVGELK
ncbi:MAG: aromatic amino acid lyase [candidate division Zixibacteria bacterium]|nr:aromatic amino acid lyase [Candidatus Tariuqbacter arcticus]